MFQNAFKKSRAAQTQEVVTETNYIQAERQ